MVAHCARGNRRIFPDSLGKIADLNFIVGTKNHGAFNRIAEFANVTRPFILRKQRAHFRGKAEYTASATIAGTSQKKVGQEGNIFRAFTQWRQLDGNYIQPMRSEE